MAFYDPAASYVIINRKSGRALSIQGAGTANTSPVILFDFVNAEDQFWHIVDSGRGYVTILNNHSGRALSTLNGKSDNFTPVHLYDDLTTFIDQHWTIDSTAAGFVTIANLNEGRRVLSCRDGGTKNDTVIHLFDYIGFANQNWTIAQVTQSVDVDAGHVTAQISPYMTGVCLEDVNHEVYGGLDSQMIFGESFQEPPAYDPNVLYKVINRKDSRALSVEGGEVADFSRAVVWQELDVADQLWRVVDIGNGFYKFLNHKKGLALSTLDGGSAKGTPVHLFDDLGTKPDQHWAIGAGTGFVAIRNQSGRQLLSCDTATRETDDGTRLHLWELVDKALDQQWCIVPFTAPAYDTAALYKIENVNSKTLLSVHGAGQINGSRVVLMHDVDRADQLWRIIFGGDGFYRLVNNASGRLLSTLDGGSDNGTIIHIWEEIPTKPDQQWTIVPVADGVVKITNRNVMTDRSGRGVVSCVDGGTADDTTIHLWQYIAFQDQDWRITPVTTLRPEGVSGMWRGTSKGNARASYVLNPVKPFKGSQSQTMSFSEGTGEIGVENRSLNRWGMSVEANSLYAGYVYLRTSAPTTVHLTFEAFDGTTVYAETSVVADEAEWTRYDFSLIPSRGDPRGRFAVTLKAPGSIDIGYVVVQPAAPERLDHALPVRRDLAGRLVQQGNTVLRFGGSSFGGSSGYRWKHTVGPRDERPFTGGFWYPFASNGWGIIDFLNFAESAGAVGIPTINVAETRKDVSDFIDYVNGATSTEFGRRRANDGHPAPYGLKYLELGNEEDVNDAYVARFQDLAEAIWLKDSEIILIVGDNFDGTKTHSTLAPHHRILDFARMKQREVWIDCHVWTDDVEAGGVVTTSDVLIREQVAALHRLYLQLQNPTSGAGCKLVVFELNAASYNMGRAMANALAIGMMERAGDEIRMVTSANALQPDGQNDNGWDQGLIFFNPSQAWAQPPYFVTKMKHDNYLPQAVRVQISGRESDTFDVTATKSADGKAMALHVVNLINVARTYAINLSGFTPLSATARVTTLAGPRTSQNSAASPTAIVPSEADVLYTRSGDVLTFTFAPSSFTIVRLQ